MRQVRERGLHAGRAILDQVEAQVPQRQAGAVELAPELGAPLHELIHRLALAPQEGEAPLALDRGEGPHDAEEGEAGEMIDEPKDARYDEAVAWFTKAYEAWQLNEFLYNIAQSYRLSGNCKKAYEYYHLAHEGTKLPELLRNGVQIDGHRHRAARRSSPCRQRWCRPAVISEFTGS